MPSPYTVETRRKLFGNCQAVANCERPFLRGEWLRQARRSDEARRTDAEPNSASAAVRAVRRAVLGDKLLSSDTSTADSTLSGNV